MNLLHETIDDIRRSGHTPDDIIFIGSERSGHQCTWAEFEILADREYDAGYGGQRVATDLKIVFSDGHTMWRGEYDGSEWWAFSKPFEMPSENHKIQSLFARSSWESLAEIHQEDES